MQSRENLAEIAIVDRELFETRIHDMLDLCAAGNLAGLMTELTEMVDSFAMARLEEG